MIRERIVRPGGALRIFGYGLLLQVFLFFVIMPALSQAHREVPSAILGPIWYFLFFLPLLGILGIIVGVRCYLQEIGTFLPLFGIAMNALWLAVLAFASWLVFVVRITV